MTIQKILSSIFYLVFLCFFIIILAVSVLAPNYHPNPFTGLASPVRGIGMVAGAAIFIGFAVAFYKTLLAASSKLTTIVSFLLAIWIVGVGLFISVTLLTDSLVDGMHVKAEALYMLENGTTSTTEYFQIYPNNIAVTIIQYFVNQIGRMAGIGNTYASEHIFLFVLTNIMIYFSWKLSVHLFNKQMGAILLFLTATFVPYFMYMLYFYTDSVIVCFVPIILYLYYKYEEKHSFWRIITLALVFGIGCQIRMNIIIMLPALVIYMIFTLSWKRTIVNTLCMLIIIATFSLGADKLYLQMGFTPDDTKEFPTTHWLMLGFSKYGGFNSEDYKFTESFPTYEEKKEATTQEIVNRIHDYGVVGLARLMVIKLDRGWACASRAYSYYLVRSQDYPIWYNYLVGNQNQTNTFFTQVWHVANITLIIAAALLERRKKVRQSLLLAVTLFGVLLFHLLWEAQPRYIYMYTPVMVLLSLYGIQGISNAIGKGEKVRLKRIVITGCILSILTLGIGAIKYPTYSSNKQPFYHYVVKQEVVMRRKATVDAEQQVSQTFQSQIPFNFIKISISEISANTVFTFELINENTGTVLYREDFSVDEDQKKIKRAFQFPQIEVEETTDFRIQISTTEENGALLLDKKSMGKYDDVDVYERGKLLINNQVSDNEDLTLIVADYSERANVPSVIYISIAVIVLAVIWGSVWMYFRLRIFHGHAKSSYAEMDVGR